MCSSTFSTSYIFTISRPVFPKSLDALNPQFWFSQYFIELSKLGVGKIFSQIGEYYSKYPVNWIIKNGMVKYAIIKPMRPARLTNNIYNISAKQVIKRATRKAHMHKNTHAHVDSVHAHLIV